MTQIHENSQKTLQLPLPPEMEEVQGMEIYARFMRYLRCVPNSRDEIKVLSSIQFTADMLDCSDAHVSKTLVNMGLRARRAAFPAGFLHYADQALMRDVHDIGGPNAALLGLKGFWDNTGDDKFAAFKREYRVLSEEAAY